MALSVTHTFVSAIPDDADATLVRPSNWNAAHTVTGTVDIADITGTVPATGGGTGQTTYAKGDILASPGSNTLNKLPVGTDTFVLTADAASTNGIKWAAASAGGTPAGSGTEIQYRNAGAFGAMAGTAWDNTNRSLTMTGATVTTSNPVLNMTQTWNAGAVTFTGLSLNITNTASAAASKYLDILVGGASKMSLVKEFTFNNAALRTDAIIGNAGNLILSSASQYVHVWLASSTPAFTAFPFSFSVSTTPAALQLSSTSQFAWCSSTASNGTNDLFLTRGGAAATLQHGAADVDTGPVAQTIQVQSALAGGTSNVAGADWILQGSRGKGTGIGGDIIFKTSPAGTSGTSVNAPAEVFRVKNTGDVGLTKISFVGGNTPTIFQSNFNLVATVSGNQCFGVAGNTVVCIPVGSSYSWSSNNVVDASSGSRDLSLTRGGAATLQHGLADAATAIAQTTQVQSVVAGTAGNVAGQDWTFIGSKGVGSGIGGDFVFKGAIASSGGGGTAQNVATEAFRIKNTGGFTATYSSYQIQFNDFGRTYFTDTGGTKNVGIQAVAGSFNIGMNLMSTGVISWTAAAADASTGDTFLRRGGAAGTFQFGAGLSGVLDQAAPVAQTLQVQSVIAGTANGTAGADWTFKASSGTGTGTGGNIILKTPFSAKSSGTGQGTWVDRDIYVSKGKVLTSATPVSLFEIALPAGAMAGGTVYATIICTNGTDMQSFSQAVSYSVVNKAGAYTKSITAATGDKSVTGGSTLTTTWTLLDGTNKSTVQVSATTSLTPSTNAFICYYSMANNSEQATTIL